MHYRVISNIKGLLNREWNPGDEVRLSEEVAAELLKSGSIEPINKPFDGKIKPQPPISNADSPFKKQLEQLHESARNAKAELHRFDGEIKQSERSLQAIYAEKVTRADFLAYLKDDFRQRSQQFVVNLRLDFLRVLPNLQFRNQECRLENGADIMLPFFSGKTSLPGMTDEAYFFYFGDLIAERFCDAIDATGLVKWGETTVPIEERRAQCKKIEAEITALQVQRDALAADLDEAGLKQ